MRWPEDNICQASPKAIDTMLVNQKRYVNVAGVGFNALTFMKFAAMGGHGFWSSFVECLMVPELTVIKPNDKNCHPDGDPIECGKILNIKVDSLSLNIIVHKSG